jgi:hypothetical protein
MRKFLNGLIVLLALYFFLQSCHSEKKILSSPLTSEYVLPDRGDYRFMFYNCENLFDTINDPNKNDEEFLPESMRHWDTRKYYKKLNNTAKVITAVGGWELPDAVGLCEIETGNVVYDIIHKTHLWKSDYKIIHYEAPDMRGIDVAFIYNSTRIFPIVSVPFHITFPDATEYKTRDILYVKATTATKDTIHFFINHWPSRWGGQMDSEDRRMYVASVVREKVDSIFGCEQNPNIIIMGDLNDYPYNLSLTQSLKAISEYSDLKPHELYNLSAWLQKNNAVGSHKHEGEWGILDQNIVSGALLLGSNGLKTSVNDAHVFSAPFLLTEDQSYTGVITNRTYIGMKYNGGYSDHLPVFLDVWKIK